LRILLFEALTAGLIDGTPSILVEGLSMLRRLAVDLCKLSWVDLYVAIDRRFIADIPRSIIPARIVMLDDPCIDDLIHCIGRMDFDKVYVIAPETNGLLYSIIRRIIDEYGYSIVTIGDIDRLGRIIDKLSLHRMLSEIGLKTPRSIDLSSASLDDLDSLGYPFIIKPRLDAGCGGLYIVSNRMDAERLVKIANYRGYIAQEYVKGLPSSLSFISDGRYARLLSINRQFVDLSSGGPSYLGGYVPLSLASIDIDKLTDKLNTLLHGLKGYIGIDTIISNGGVYVIEVNPRLTVSYIGLSRCCRVNPAEAIAEAAFHDRLRVTDGFRGFSVFLKVRCVPLNINPYLDDRVEAYIHGYSLISGFGYSLRDAWIDLINARRRLDDRSCRIGCRRS